METEFRLTGRHVLGTLIGFFLFVLTANMIFLNFALRTFPGEKEEKSYLQGLNYNERLSDRAEQALLGWNVTIEEASLNAGQAQLIVTIKSGQGTALSGLDVTGMMSRPADDVGDNAIVFVEGEKGKYIASSPAAAGVWNLEAKAINSYDEVFTFTSRLILQ